ncbi:hypothetical protein AAHA92_17704 [Salvia divinorum]|uniref:Myb/SANT-like domain-containing protein n=2 Tax=Salvia divinorum TaxID=28513 RepID=A0ABD1GZM3_SALDI
MWSDREEQILVVALLELVALGWKSDNGFRAGYLKRIEDSVRKEFPSSDIKGTPHVTSKITSWKKSYNSLQGILSRSGVGFNVHNDFKIDCDDEQWAQIVQIDNHARFMRDRSWPFWEQWKIIFGKERATGGGAENMEDAAAAVRAENAAHNQATDNEYHVSFDDFVVENTSPVATGPDNPEDSTSHTQQQVPQKTSSDTKRKNSSGDAAMMEFLGNLHAETNARLEIISARIGYEFDLGKARQEVFNMLGSVDGLSMDQRYELCDILGDKSQRLEIFMGMPVEARPGYVLRLIEQNHKTT